MKNPSPQLVSTAVIAISFAAFFTRPSWEASLLIIFSFCLYGFLNFIEKKDENKHQEIQDKFKYLENRIDSLQLGRAIGR